MADNFNAFVKAHTDTLAVKFLMDTLGNPHMTLAETRDILNTPELQGALETLTWADIFNDSADVPKGPRVRELTILERCVELIKDDGTWIDAHDLAERVGSSHTYINQTLQKGIAENTVPLLVRWVKNIRGRNKPEYRYVPDF